MYQGATHFNSKDSNINQKRSKYMGGKGDSRDYFSTGGGGPVAEARTGPGNPLLGPDRVKPSFWILISMDFVHFLWKGSTYTGKFFFSENKLNLPELSLCRRDHGRILFGHRHWKGTKPSHHI
jgi:hypothetical protein